MSSLKRSSRSSRFRSPSSGRYTQAFVVRRAPMIRPWSALDDIALGCVMRTMRRKLVDMFCAIAAALSVDASEASRPDAALSGGVIGSARRLHTRSP